MPTSVDTICHAGKISITVVPFLVSFTIDAVPRYSAMEWNYRFGFILFPISASFFIVSRFLLVVSTRKSYSSEKCNVNRHLNCPHQSCEVSIANCGSAIVCDFRRFRFRCSASPNFCATACTACSLRLTIAATLLAGSCP